MRTGSWALVTSACLMMGPRVALGAAPAAEAGTGAEVEREGSAPARVLVLPARVSGKLPPNTADEVRKLVAQELVDEAVTVLPADAAAVADCDEACRVAVAERAGAEYLVQPQVVGEEDEFTVTLTLFAGGSGAALAPFSRECSICGFVEVRDMVRLASLDARAEVVRRRRVSAPAPRVEGPQVQPTTTAPRLAPRSRLVLAGWGLVGAGSAATIGGVVLLALHHQDAGCQTNPRGGDCVPLRFTTAPVGGALLGAGVATLVAGVVLVVVGGRAEQRELAGGVALRPRGTGLELRF